MKAWWDSHHETEGGSGEPLEITINEVFTFQGRPDKWGFTVIRFVKPSKIPFCFPLNFFVRLKTPTTQSSLEGWKQIVAVGCGNDSKPNSCFFSSAMFDVWDGGHHEEEFFFSLNVAISSWFRQLIDPKAPRCSIALEVIPEYSGGSMFHLSSQIDAKKTNAFPETCILGVSIPSATCKMHTFKSFSAYTNIKI